MERRTVLLIVAVAVAFTSLGGAFCVWAFGPDDLEEKAKQVQAGTTESEVEAILGKAHQYVTRNNAWWFGDRVLVVVNFSEIGKVDEKLVERIPLWNRLRAKLPW